MLSSTAQILSANPINPADIDEKQHNSEYEWYVDQNVKPQLVKIHKTQYANCFISVELSGRHYLCVAMKDIIHIIDIDTGNPYKILCGHEGSIDALFQLKDGRLISGSSDKTIKVWGIENEKCTHTLEGHDRGINVFFQMKNGVLLSGSEDRTINVWDVTKMDLIRSIGGELTSFYSIIEMDDEKILIGSYGTIRIINTVSGELASIFDLRLSGQIFSIIELKNNHVLCAFVRGSITEFDPKNNKIIKEWEAHKSPVTTLVKLNDGRILSGDSAGLIKIWDENSGQCIATMKNKNEGYRHNICQLADGLVVSLLKSSLNLWDVGSRRRLRSTLGDNPLSITTDVAKCNMGIIHRGTLNQSNVSVLQLVNHYTKDEEINKFNQAVQKTVPSQNEYIVKLHGYCFQQYPYFVMDNIESGSLYDLLHNNSELSFELRFTWVKQMAQGMMYLHTNNIQYPPLNSSQIIVDENNNIKIAYFSYAKLNQNIKDLNWLAPELLIGEKPNKASDIYSFGQTVWEIYSRKIPYESAEDNPTIIAVAIKEGEKDNIPVNCPPKVAHLIQWCRNTDPKDRPTVEQVVDYLKAEENLVDDTSLQSSLTSKSF